MTKITSNFITYRTNSHASKLRHIKSLGHISLNSMQRPKIFKKSLAALQHSKFHRVINFVNIHRIPARYLSFICKVLQKSFKFLKKVLFKGTSPSSLFKHPPTFKRIFIKFARLETLSLVSFEARYLKYCRSLRNLKLSIPEEPKTSSYVLSQVRSLSYLERVEVCISNANLALSTLKEVHRRIKSKHCWLDITLLKAFWPCMDNIEALSTPNFKKVASVQLDLAKLPATPSMIDHKKLELHLNFLKFLLEPINKVHHKHKQFERIRFPGMKLKLDSKEYMITKKTSTLIKQLEDLKLEVSGSPIGSFLENCLSVYASSVFYCLNRLDVVEYQPEQNLAKLYFELTSWASAWEVLELLKDIIDFKNIKYLYLELEVKEISNDEFKAIIEEICKIERLQFLYVASGSFILEVENPCERKLDGLLEIEKGKAIRLKA